MKEAKPIFGRRSAIALAALLAVAALAYYLLSSGGRVPTYSITVGSTTLDVVVVQTRADRRDALVKHTQVRPFAPFLIAEARPRYLHYHSEKEVSRRLDVVFLDGAGKIVDWKTMELKSDEGVTSAAEAQFALFLEGGQFARTGAKTGAVVKPPDGLKPEERAAITFKGKEGTAYVEVALTEDEQRRGLMFRDRMSADDGMIFKYPEERPAIKGHYMKNTRIPLTIAYVNEAGVIVTLADLKPLDDTNIPATAPWSYALEMNLGWFARHGIAEGDRLIIPGEIRSASAKP